MNRTRGPTAPKWLVAIALTIVTLSAVDCANNDARDDELRSVRQSLDSIFDVTLDFPSGWAYDKVAIYGTKSVTISNNVVLKDTSGAPATVLSLGTGSLLLKAGTKTGTLASGGSVTLSSGASVTGDVQAAGKVDPPNPPSVTGKVSPNTPLGPLSNLQFTVTYPRTTANLALDRSDAAGVVPGIGYGKIILHSQSTAKLAAGVYYLDTLETEPQTTLALDTRSGPVIVHVREHLNFKGKISITGPSGRFFLGYYGTESTSIESPFNGTIVAPNAALRLAPVGGNPGHRGSFFAKSIDSVEAGSVVTFEPFSDWFKIVDIRPIVDCVRRYKAPYGSALLGYENRSGVAVTIPAGPSNTLSPTGPTPPTVFEPGLHPREVWVPFDLTQTATWTLAGQSVVASASNRLCVADDVTAPPANQPPPILSDSPDMPGPATMARIKPDVRSPASSSLPAPVHGGTYFQPTQAPAPPSTPKGDIGVITQGLDDGEVGSGPFTFEVTALHYSGDEGLCGSIDPFIGSLVINGTDFGKTGSATVQVPRNQRTVKVHVHIVDSDGGLCFGDDDLADFDAEIDNVTNGSACASAGPGSVCWKATTSGSPAVCFDWNAQFIDAGPWTGVDAEDFAASKDVQRLPASFARVAASIERQGRRVYEYTGILDKNGCIPGSKLPEAGLWAPGANTVVRLSHLSQYCIDPTGSMCEQGGTPTSPTFGGASIVVEAPGANGPTALCTVFAEDPAAVNEPGCVVKPITWTDRPPSPVRPAYDDENSVTRAAAVISQILAREDETRGDLGVVAAFVDARVEEPKGTVPMVIKVDEYCCYDDHSRPASCTSPKAAKWTTCREGSNLLLQPDGKVPGATRFKYIVAHEFAHFVQGNAIGTFNLVYGEGAGLAGQPPLCRCDSVNPDDQLHCLQSLEDPGAAQIEGFAQFFAAKVWNRDFEKGCTFVYYKNFEDASCLPGVEDCSPASDGNIVNHPPIPVACNFAKRWRNTHCIDASSSVDVLRYGVEYDWMEFLHAINNDPNPAKRWDMVSIFNSYLVACGGYDPNAAASCLRREVSWSGSGATERSLVKGAYALVGGEQTNMARSFREAGDTYGVSEVP